MSRGYGYVFLKWTKYYIVGKVYEANLFNDASLWHQDQQHGDARFSIEYFGDVPPAGVSKESFGDSNLQFISRDDRIKVLVSLLGKEISERELELNRKAIGIEGD